MVSMDSFPKIIASMNSYRNARITTTLNLLTSWTLHILQDISHWQLQILGPPLDFSTPKKLSLGGPCPPRATTPLTTGEYHAGTSGGGGGGGGEGIMIHMEEQFIKAFDLY